MKLIMEVPQMMQMVFGELIMINALANIQRIQLFKSSSKTDALNIFRLRTAQNNIGNNLAKY